MANYNLTQTGAQVQQLLDTVAAGYIYMGAADLTTTPDTTNPNVCYLLKAVGTYTNFGNITHSSGITIAMWNGTAWSYQNVPSSAVVPTDATITENSVNPVQSGAVYDEVSQLEHKVDEKVGYDLSVNLFDRSNALSGYFINGSGYSALTNYYLTQPIKVLSGKTYKYEHPSGYGTNYYIAKCDYQGNLINVFTGTYSDGFVTFTANEDMYIRANAGVGSYADSFMFCLASEYPSTFVPYERRVGDKYGLGKRQNEQIDEKISGLVEIEGYFQKTTSVNLFDSTDATIKNGYYASGTFVSDSIYRVTGPIPVKSGITYKAPHPSEVGANAYIALVNNVNEIIGFVSGTLSGNYITYTPGTDCYLSFNIGARGNLSTFMVCKEDEYPSTYIPYEEFISLNGVLVPSSSPLVGKSVIFTGDSICSGAYDDNNGGGWAKRIGVKNNMQWQNKAVAGGVIMDKSIIGGSFTICDTDFGEGADYIILEGGTNDADRIGSILNGNIPEHYGSYTINDYVTQFSASTFCSAVERLIQRVVTSFPYARVGFIIAPKMGVANLGYSAETNNRRAYFETIIKICQKWGVPVLNLWDECTMNPRLASHYTEGQDYLYADGQHPTAKGYELMTSIIEKWMESL